MGFEAVMLFSVLDTLLTKLLAALVTRSCRFCTLIASRPMSSTMFSSDCDRETGRRIGSISPAAFVVVSSTYRSMKSDTYWFVFGSELISLGMSISRSSTTVTLLRSVFRLTCCSVIG
uniref:Putative secreted peptide n=1 Tax=Anopheles braziliensis TaxID=58242 RepID=A0A2M3ZSX5_9DIPT